MTELTQWVYYSKGLSQEQKLNSRMSNKRNLADLERIGEPVLFENLSFPMQFAKLQNHKRDREFEIQSQSEIKFKFLKDHKEDNQLEETLFKSNTHNLQSLNIMWEFSKNLYHACETLGFSLESIRTEGESLKLKIFSFDVLKNREAALGILRAYTEVSAYSRGFKVSEMEII